MPVLGRPTSAPALDEKAVAGRLARLDAAYRTRWTTLMLLGFGVVWVGPVFFTMIIWMCQFWAHSDATESVSTWGTATAPVLANALSMN